MTQTDSDAAFRDAVTPAIVTFQFKIQADTAPSAQCLALLSEVMRRFDEKLLPRERDAIAAWFAKNYTMLE